MRSTWLTIVLSISPALGAETSAPAPRPVIAPNCRVWLNPNATPDLDVVPVTLTRRAELQLADRQFDPAFFERSLRSGLRQPIMDASRGTERTRGGYLWLRIGARRHRVTLSWDQVENEVLINDVRPFGPREHVDEYERYCAAATVRNVPFTFTITDGAVTEMKTARFNVRQVGRALDKPLGHPFASNVERTVTWHLGDSGVGKTLLSYRKPAVVPHVIGVKRADRTLSALYEERSFAVHNDDAGPPLAPARGALAGTTVLFRPGLEAYVRVLDRITRAEVIEAVEATTRLALPRRLLTSDHPRRRWSVVRLATGRILKLTFHREPPFTRLVNVVEGDAKDLGKFARAIFE